MKQFYTTVVAVLCMYTSSFAQPTIIVPYGSSWKYLDNGSNQGTAWSKSTFNDDSWASGNAELGYGDGDETTVVSFGSRDKKKYITTYFRNEVNISDPSAYTSFVLNIKRDDGAVVYINGQEVFRTNIAAGTVTYTTRAALASDDGKTAQSATLPVSDFAPGNNIIAVEIHQYRGTDPDISFDLSLAGNPKANDTPPVANAGPDQTITVPASSATLDGSGSTDADGTITGYAWTQVSGPSSATIGNPGSINTSVSNLVEGTYTFHLVVTDNAGATGADEVEITVASQPNVLPVANAGPDQAITLPTNSVTLNGSGSTDKDGTIVLYEWTKVSGPSSGTITSPDNVSTTVTGLVAGTYIFRLTVTDNDDATDTNDMTVVVNAATNNIPPAAHAGGDQTITLPTNSVTLKGSGSDADGTIVAYAWTKVSGPAAGTITDPSKSSTTATGLVQGVYTFRLTVTDNDGATDTNDMLVTVNGAANNTPPNASAGPDQTITLPTNSVTLNGGGSTDADGTITAYAWTKVSGPSSGTITSPNSVSTTVTGLVQGTYTFRLTVTDNNGATDTNDMLVTVNAATSNTPPNASAGPDQTITLPANSVTLNGGGSTDADGTITAYAWTKVSGPSSGAITNPNSVSTTVTGLVQGTYTFRLTVTDNNGATDTNDMLVTVNAATSNTPPNANAGPDQTITLPTNAVTLDGSGSSDANGTITAYAWTKVSGPSSGTITSPGSATTSVTGLVQGTYVFRLTVTDNDGATDTNDMTVIVNAASGGTITLTRGPYLQMGNSTAVTLRWRTDVASDSKISVGTTFGTYTTSATNSTSTTEHEVRITGLSADKKYYYSFGSSSQTLQAGSDNFFTTAPPASTTRKIRVAAFGDCGRNSNGFQSGSLSSYRNYVGNNPAELMLLMGDNAYDAGTDAEYASNFFGVYSSSILKNHILFPSPGNHDYANSSSRQADHNIPYYSIFTMPIAAECGGVASGTEAYYSYNWGNIHFLSLDSYGYESGSTRLYDTLGPQVKWIKQDLAANTKKWTIAYWHHPPYTMGSHNSDTESELVKIRQNFIRILERYGVDMVLCGHSHDYERSYLLKGYYGNESSFNVANNAVTSSSGMYDGSSNSCAYNLQSGQVDHGTVYVVSGSSGADGSVESGYPHNAMPFSVDDGGMFYFEVEDNRLDAKFIRRDGVIADKFTIVKDAGQSKTVSIASGQSVTLTASWIGNYEWSTGASTRSITVSPASSTTYTCSDGSNCITDNFTVNVGSPMKQITLAPSDEEGFKLDAYPTPVQRGSSFTVSSTDAGVRQVIIMNDKGQKVKQFTLQGMTRVSTTDMLQGVYYLRTEYKGKKVMKKIIVM